MSTVTGEGHTRSEPCSQTRTPDAARELTECVSAVGVFFTFSVARLLRHLAVRCQSAKFPYGVGITTRFPLTGPLSKGNLAKV